MLISHLNKYKDVWEAGKHVFPDWNLAKCKYVPAATLQYFFSTSILKLRIGVMIFLFGKNSSQPFYLDEEIVSKEKHKKVGKVWEFVLKLYNFELRMEGYLNFVNQDHVQDLHEVPNFLYITSGRKPMIAVVVSHPHLEIVVVQKHDSLNFNLSFHSSKIFFYNCSCLDCAHWQL